MHFHNEFELNLITNFKGKRTVGDSLVNINGSDLVLLGPELKHYWKTSETISNTNVITLQFQKHFLSSEIMSYSVSKDIKKMLELSKLGLAFSHPTKEKVTTLLLKLENNNTFKSLLIFLEILHILSISKDYTTLSNPPSANYNQIRESRRISLITNYIEKYYENDIKLKNIAELVNMSESAFSHYFKKRTNLSFTNYLQNYRLGMVTKFLTETNMSINEICYKSGFNSLSNFNRLFKRKYNMSPKEFKVNYHKQITN